MPGEGGEDSVCFSISVCPPLVPAAEAPNGQGVSLELELRWRPLAQGRVLGEGLTSRRPPLSQWGCPPSAALSQLFGK